VKGLFLSAKADLGSFLPVKEPSLRAGGNPLGGYVPRDSVVSRHRRSHGSRRVTPLRVGSTSSQRAVDQAHGREGSFAESRGPCSRRRRLLRREPWVHDRPSPRAMDLTLGKEVCFFFFFPAASNIRTNSIIHHMYI
jgi:hypothetical protein